MIYFVDIDNTICRTSGNDYDNSVPILENIAKINRLFDAGNTIVYWTSRGNSSGKDLCAFTFEQLKRWGCRFHSLKMGKDSYDIIIDDKAKRIEEI